MGRRYIRNPAINNIVITTLMGLDLETQGRSPVSNKVLCIALNNGDETYVLDTAVYNHADLVGLFEKLSTSTIIAHNAKFDSSFIFSNYGVKLNKLFCTMLAEQVLTNGKSYGVGLTDTLSRRLGNVYSVTNKKDLQKSFIAHPYGTELITVQLDYAAEDVNYLIDLKTIQEDIAAKTHLTNILTLENKLIPVLVEMECIGTLIDITGWQKLIIDWKDTLFTTECLLDAELVKLSKDFPKLKGGKFTRKRRRRVNIQNALFDEPTEVVNKNAGNVNYASSFQIKDIFNRCGQKLPTTKHGKESVGEDPLSTYLTENSGSPLKDFVALLLKYREYAKLISTYGESFLKQLDKNGRIHTEYTQCFTDTGRLSSKRPNLQNIPGILRKYFIPDVGMKFITYDMSGAELRIAAEFSEEKLLINSLIGGADMHSDLATTSFRIITGKKDLVISKSTDPIKFPEGIIIPVEARDLHKRVTFGKLYKAGAGRIYQVLAPYINMFHPPEMRLEIAKQVSIAFDKRVPTLSKWLSSMITIATTKRPLGDNLDYYLRANYLGRIRFFQSDSYGDAANYRIQATNADAIKFALIKIHAWLNENCEGNVLLTVHDEISIQVPEAKAEEAEKALKTIIEYSLGIFLDKIPSESSGGIENHWSK